MKHCFLKLNHRPISIGIAMVFGTIVLGAAEPIIKSENASVRHEVKRAIDKGLAWLEKDQNTNGFWSTADHPAITALALIAFEGRVESERLGPEAPPIKKGYAFLLSCVKTNGGIYRNDLPSYNTSVALTAFCAANRAEYRPLIQKARQFLIGFQYESVDSNDPLNGGIGYGTQDKTPDLSNTSLALEALYHSKQIIADKNNFDAKDLNWPAAIRFLQNCQNLPDQNHQKWASDDSQNQGGFVYAPGNSKAGETNLAPARIALRSYGSMSYAGLLSYIYADLRRDDPRVNAVMDWLRSNYTLAENPGMGQQGLFYYYHTMAKALTLYGGDTIETKEGKKIKWREELALKLIDLQLGNGSWSNPSGRWFEKDADLVTAYAVIALDMVYGNL
ncbi:MAG: cycloartenol synthase-like protein [Verrucomicrobiales bacterium]|nr:cycloartenol synthase-like protein [Verrucomicrobiales bacterium]